MPAETKVVFPVLATAKITGQPYGMFCVADFNNDMQPDFAVSDRTKGSESVDVYLNNGDGTLIKKASYPVGRYPQHIAAGDFNEDGNVDLIVPVYLGSLGYGKPELPRTYRFKVAPGDVHQNGDRGDCGSSEPNPAMVKRFVGAFLGSEEPHLEAAIGLARSVASA